MAAIDARLDLLIGFVLSVNAVTMCAQLRVQPDMQRALSRLSMGHGGPRDLAALAAGLGGQHHCGYGAHGSGLWLCHGQQPDDLPVFWIRCINQPLVHSLTPALGDDLPLLP
ncbi:MAG: hypothetical protein CM15mP46_0590 [Alphaproteobacteria bacterium]|nr:MAG: hypothetical protein CM15mP46_0590 [Alphaproteobacteria bacterium]